jgi:DNA-binding PadR family transcriptional regulator
MKGDYLGAFEELVLLAVAALGDDAYGVPVQERVERDAERIVSLGAVYAALDRLDRKGLVTSWIGESAQYRGGRRKRHFAITAEGRAALGEMRRVREKMWRSLSAAASSRTS